MVLGEYKYLRDWDFAGGEAEYQKAFAIDPNDATIHQWHAEKRAAMGDAVESVMAEFKLAHELDPLSLIVSATQGAAYVTYWQFRQGPSRPASE